MNSASDAHLRDLFVTKYLFSDLMIIGYEVSGNSLTTTFQIGSITFCHSDLYSFDLTDLTHRIEFKKLAQYFCLIKAFKYSQHFLLRSITLNNSLLNQQEERFWQMFYDTYSMELYYSHQLPIEHLTKIFFNQFSQTRTDKGTQGVRKKQNADILIGVGGGKDAIYAFETLEQSGIPTDLFYSFQDQIDYKQRSIVANYMAKKYARQVTSVERKEEVPFEMKEEIIAQKKRGIKPSAPAACGNAIRMAIVALKYDYSYITTANEKSADFGNTQYYGRVVNHQYGKSFEFEKLFSQLLTSLTEERLHYFSLLKPLYEISIAKGFSKLEEYFPHFVSCNEGLDHWCNNCAKCVFVFTLLAGFIPPDKISEIFSQNLFDRDDLMYYFRELMGLTGVKPLECVGEKEEVWIAMAQALELGYKGAALELFSNEALPTISLPSLKQNYYAIFDDPHSHQIPKEILKKIRWL